MASVVRTTVFLFSIFFLAVGVLADDKPTTEKEGLTKSVHQIMQMENIKLEAISGFITALLTMIALIPKAVMQVIEKKVHWDISMLESLFGGMSTDGSPQASIDFVNSQLHKYAENSGGSSSSFNLGALFKTIQSLITQHSSSGGYGSSSGSGSYSGSGSSGGSGSSSGSGSSGGSGSSSGSGSSGGTGSSSGSGSSGGSGSSSGSGTSGGTGLSGYSGSSGGHGFSGGHIITLHHSGPVVTSEPH